MTNTEGSAGAGGDRSRALAGRTIYRSTAGRDAIVRWCTDQLDAWPVAHERRVVAVRRASTHVITAGEGEPTVVFVPGTNFSAATCLPLATALAGRSRLVVADLPGQPGLSSAERVHARGRLAWYGQWLAEVVDHTANAPVVLMGHSLGAAIALSSDVPLVRRQVLVSPGGLTRLRITPAVLVRSMAWVLRRSSAASARLLAVMHGPGHGPRPELVDWMTLIARHVRSSADPGGAAVPHGEVERSVVVGQHDVFLPADALAPTVRQTLGVTLGVIASAGHLVIDEYPDEIADLVIG